MNGITYSHEHMAIDLSKGKNNPDCNLNAYEEALDELKQLHALGVDRIVDCSNTGIGRNVDVIRQIEADTGIEILLSCGYYKDPFLPDEVRAFTVEELAAKMLTEIEQGVNGKPVSFIGEIGTSLNVMTPDEEKVFAAACIAHRQSGIPIITHTTLGTMAKEQVAFFKVRGVDLSKVIISHTALAKDEALILSLLSEGVNIAFDTIGKLNYASDELRAEMLSHCIHAGYTHQLFMSMDLTRKSHLKKYGGVGYDYLLKEFIRLLKANGVSDEALEIILCKNIEKLLVRR